MKQYLWLGIAAIFVSAHASDNPFELKSNFGQLDQDQELLLGDLKKMAEAKEHAEEKAEAVVATEPAEVISDSLSVAVEGEVPVNASNEVGKVKQQVQTLTEAEKASEEQLNTMRAAALATLREEAVKKEAAKEVKIETAVKTNIPKNNDAAQKARLLEEVQKKEAELAAAKKEVAEKEAAKKEAEKREVEAYEKQRAEKLAKQVEAEVLEREALAQKAVKSKQQEAEKTADLAQRQQKEAEAVATKAKQDEVEKKVALLKQKEAQTAAAKVKLIKASTSKAVKATPSSSATPKVNDIDVEKEKIEAKKAADKAYEKAVKEMSKED